MNALQDVENAMARDASLARQKASAARQRATQERVSREIRTRYNAGRASSLDLIREEEGLIRIQEQEVRLWEAGMTNLTTILRALGVDPVADS